MKGTLKVDKPISNKSSHQVQYNSKMIGEKEKQKKGGSYHSTQQALVGHAWK